jgi:hypothetical protein
MPKRESREAVDLATLGILQDLRHEKGKPWRTALEDWQWGEFFMPLLALDADGAPCLRLGGMFSPKGYGKSIMLAAFGIAKCTAHARTRAYSVSGDAEQATIILDHAKNLIEQTPALRGKVKVQADRLTWDNGSVLRVLTADAPTLHGLGGLGRAFLVLADEVSVWRDRAVWDALWSASGKLPATQFVVASNPGLVRSGLAWDMFRLMTSGTVPWAHAFCPEDTIRPKWLTVDWVERMQATLPPALVQALVRGQWADGDDSFVTRAEVEAATDPHAAEFLDPAFPVVLGLDVGVRHDRSVLEGVTWKDGAMVHCAQEVWDPDRQRTGEVLLADIESTILAIAAQVPVLGVSFDPWQWYGSAQRLKGKVPLTEVAMGPDSQCRLAMTLRTALTTGRLRLLPDKAFADELTSLQIVPGPKPGTFRFDHRKGMFSDRVMALALAVSGADAFGPWRRAEVFLGGRRDTAAFIPCGPMPHDRDQWLDFGERHGGMWADEVQEGPGGAYGGGRRTIH